MATVKDYLKNAIKQEEIDKYLIDGKDFIDDALIHSLIEQGKNPDKSFILDIIQKALSIIRLEPKETAALLNVKDDRLWDEIFKAAGEIKKKVYDNRIVTFAPLYCSNYCVNNCLYCGFRVENEQETRRILSLDEVHKETEALLKIGHKRLILVYGEHPKSNIDYMVDTIKAVYDTSVKTRNSISKIRRVNINAAPMSIADLKKLKNAGIGTYQVFQETYHHKTYKKVHPLGIKADYRWRLYTLHRGMDAGIDDLAIGALFGLYDWRFEVMGMLYHAIDLERRYNIGPHTISFPRLTPASGSQCRDTRYKVSDEDFKKLVAVLRLSIPYSGMIITARESEQIRNEMIPIGCTQTDASTRIGIGAYSESYEEQENNRQQFMLGDTRTLDKLIGYFAHEGIITSFCTAGYRCGRTGDKIMRLLKTGEEGKFCKLNAILTFKEWLDDFGSPDTIKLGDELIQKEIAEAIQDDFFKKHKLLGVLDNFYERIKKGERDLYV